MIKAHGFAIVFVVLFTCVIGTSAWADPFSDCKDKVDVISVTGPFNADTATLAHLTAKQEAASLALIQNDAAAAKTALEALKSKVTEFSEGAHPKISAADAKPLLGDVDAALACVQALTGS